VRVDGNNDASAIEQMDEALDLDIADDGVSDQNVGNAALIDEHLSLAELGACQPDGACLELQPGDVGALVRLGVWPQCYAMADRERGHLGNIPLQQVEIDGDERSVERLIASDDGMIGLLENRVGRAHS
jgi:hypothetical protein